MEYTPKNILVTGGAGFIASHFLVHMVKKYPMYNFYNLDALTYCSSLKRVQEIEQYPNYEFIKGTICSVDLVDYVMKEKKIDTVVHLAAESSVDRSFNISLTFTETNVLGTHVLLECALKNSVNRFFHISTDEVYGNMQDRDAAKEDSLLAPTNPYASSKVAAEFLVKSYAKSFKLNTVISRSNNIYGRNQFSDKVIPKFAGQILDGKKMSIHGDGSPLRTYLHYKDIVSALDIVLHKGVSGSIYNIGGKSEMSNNVLAKKIAILMGKVPEEVMEYVPCRPFNDLRYHINCEAIESLGWGETVDFDEGLKDTIEWIKNHPGYFD